MNLIPTPATLQDAPEGSRPMLDAVAKKVGRVPNLFLAMSLSPAALEGYLGLSGALTHGALPAATRERIALAVAEVNACAYCLAAHTFFGRVSAKLDDAEITANRNGFSNDPLADAAVRFAVQVARQRGHVGDDAVVAVREAGYSDEQIIEIVQHVALNTLTNYFNVVFSTPLDFPAVPAQRAA